MENLMGNLHGVIEAPLKVIPTNNGAVLHFLKKYSAFMPDFPREIGEIYFSEIKKGCVSSWKLHGKQIQNFAVPVGLLRLVLYDVRPDSRSEGRIAVTLLGRPEHYKIIKIPAGIVYGFQGLSDEPALICNCASQPHDPVEAGRIKIPEVPYQWPEVFEL